MSEDQERGRRRPVREYESSASRSPLDASGSGSSRHSRKREDSAADEPRSKVRRDEADVSVPPQRSERPSTSRGISREDESAVEQRDFKRTPSQDQGAGDARPTNDRRGNRFENEMVVTRPTDLISKKGKSGEPIRLQTNFFRLNTTPSWTIHQYHVNFEPEVELRRVRGGILSEHSKLFGGYLYDGMKLYTVVKQEKEITQLKAKSREGNDYIITLKFVGVITMNQWQSLQVLNLILRRSMEGLNLQLIGRNFFDSKAKVDLREHRLQIWPGYQTGIRQFETDIMLCAEITHKVVRQETLYDILLKCSEKSHDYKEDYKRNVLGLTIMTYYNNKTYRINEVDFSKTPLDTFNAKGKDISYADYYLTRYNLRIRDTKQPLLLTKSKDNKKMKGGDPNELIVLIPEFCRATGMTDSMRADFQLMRSMADQTRVNPERRMDRLRTFNRRLQETDASMKVLHNWNMRLDKHLVELTGRRLNLQNIYFGSREKKVTNDKADWTQYFRNSEMFTMPSRGLERWAVIATNRNTRELRSFIEALIRAASSMRFKIQRPTEKLLYDDRNHSFLQAMDECCRNDPKLVLCLVPNNNSERYALIKKKSCLEYGIPTQVVTQRSAGNPKGLMSIATKVAIQINCKLGYTPWSVDIPLSGLMTIGYDVAKSTRDRSKAFGALVATMDMKTNATFYSTVTECSSYDMLAGHLWPMIVKALRQYQNEHKALPNRILFYRDGVSEGSLKQLVEFEVKDIVEKLEIEYRKANASQAPMFSYIVVTKSTSTRFFANGQNPPPGTIVDDVVTQPEHYDFYLVSQSVRQGTVSPTKYNVLYNKINLEPDKLQLLTYRMCHLYYNWSGTTRVPAVCQYAKKLATLVATNLYQSPMNVLEKKLYFL